MSAGFPKELEGLNRVLPSPAIAFRSGQLAKKVESFTDAAEARRRLIQFGGVGWYQDADTCRMVKSPGDWAEMGAYPVEAESAKGFNSLHLRHAGEGWTLVSIEETNEPGGLLATQSFLSTEEPARLVYTVGYALETIGNHQEWRPVAYRLAAIEENRHEQ